MPLREQVHDESLEPLAADQPEEAEHEHEDEIGDHRADGRADADQHLLGGAQQIAHLPGDVEVEVQLLLNVVEEAEEVALVLGEIVGQGGGLADDRLDEQRDQQSEEDQQRDVHDDDAERLRNVAYAHPLHERPDPFCEHDRHQHGQYDADDAGEKGHQRHDRQHDQRRGHEHADAHHRPVVVLRSGLLLRGGSRTTSFGAAARFRRGGFRAGRRAAVCHRAPAYQPHKARIRRR